MTVVKDYKLHKLALFLATTLFVVLVQVFYTSAVNIALYFWMPVLNLAAVALQRYIEGDLTSMLQEADGLEKLKYSMKAA